MTKPLILSPAGSYEAFVAAINAGADEVYFGLPEFNARYNAKNFTDQELEKALFMCRILGVKSNITVNTLITDKEMPKALDMVYNAASLGADAFIVQENTDSFVPPTDRSYGVSITDEIRIQKVIF